MGISFEMLVPIIEKYWKSYQNYEAELKEACLAFGKIFSFNKIAMKTASLSRIRFAPRGPALFYIQFILKKERRGSYRI